MQEKQLKLIRTQAFQNCIRGVIYIRDDKPLFTLERTWEDNARSVSCIPEGRYRCVWQESHRFGWCYEVRDVLDRSRILFHAGNTYKDSSGCILLGRSLGTLKGEPGVLDSRLAMEDFHGVLDKQNFILEIQNGF